MKICQNCNTTLDDFLESGILGCEECYSTFKGEIDAFLLKEQGKLYHVGKTPTGKSYKENLAEAYLKLLKQKSSLESEGMFDALPEINQKISLLEEEIYERGTK